MARVTMSDVLKAVEGLGNQIEDLNQRITTLEKGSKPRTANTKKPVTKGNGNGKKGVAKQQTWTEKKEKWAKAHFTTAERKAFGEAKRTAREKQNDAYQKTVKFFEKKGKVKHEVFMKKYQEYLAK